MRRYGVLAASLVIEACLGGLLAWSEFVPALCGQYGLTTAQTQAVFGAMVASFTLSMVAAGRLLPRLGPRALVALGGLLLATGYIAGSFSRGSFPLLLLGTSLVGGAGIGLGYLCPIAVCIRLFPGREGAVTGTIVAGFGSGAIVLSNVVRPVLGDGADVLEVLRGVGMAYGAIVVPCALALPARLARPAATAGHGPELRRVLRDPALWVLCVGMFAGTCAGLMVTGNIRPLAIAAGLTGWPLGLAVSALAAGNTLGRVLWGAISDRIGWRAIPGSLAMLTAAVALLLPATRGGPGFVLACAAVGLGFGACFVVNAAQVVARWGPGALATVYPIIFLFYGTAGLVGPALGGRLYDTTGTYAAAAALAALATAVGCLVTCALGRLSPDR